MCVVCVRTCVCACVRVSIKYNVYVLVVWKYIIIINVCLLVYYTFKHLIVCHGIAHTATLLPFLKAGTVS